MADTKSTRTAAGKKNAGKKKAGKKKTVARKTATRKTASQRKSAGKADPGAKPAKPARPKKKPAGKVSSTTVNLGHVFALRPRVKTSFRQADFLTAKHLLQDEAYASIEEAARAVAEKALGVTHSGPSKRSPRR